MGAAYQSQAISGYNASPPPDDSTTVAANKITWNSTIKSKLADPLNTFIAAVNSQLVTWSDFSSVTTSTSLTTNASHHMQSIEVTSGSPTISLGDAATMTKNYIVTVTNEGTGAPVINLATAANTLDGTSNGTFTFPTGTKTSFTFKVNNGATGYDTEKIGGKSPFVYGSLITPSVDSGTTGSLALKTNNGTTQFNVTNSQTITATGTTSPIYGRFTNTSGDFIVGVEGSAGNTVLSNSGAYAGVIGAIAAQKFQIGANNNVQAEFSATASTTRWITVSGSNGGNPTINTTAGNLAITPSVVIAGNQLFVGTNPAVAGVICIPNNQTISARNAANSGDFGLLTFSNTNVILLGNGTSDIEWNRANISLGGGSSATLGTIGGSGPAATAQRNWLRFIESDGTASFIPVFR